MSVAITPVAEPVAAIVMVIEYSSFSEESRMCPNVPSATSVSIVSHFVDRGTARGLDTSCIGAILPPPIALS